MLFPQARPPARGLAPAHNSVENWRTIPKENSAKVCESEPGGVWALEDMESVLVGPLVTSASHGVFFKVPQVSPFREPSSQKNVPVGPYL